MTKFLKWVLLLAGTGCLAFALIPSILYGIVNVGVAALVALALGCYGLAALLVDKRPSPWEVFAQRGQWKGICRVTLAVLLGGFLVAELALSGCMYWFGIRSQPQPDSAATAVVLGAGLKNDQPSRMLIYRLESALLYLTAHPEARVVVTGGLGPKATRTEGAVAAQWLTQRGIAPERILVEEQSMDTQENLRYTAALLTQNQLPLEMVLFTDGFHQWRSQLYARLAVAENSAQPNPAGFFGASVTGVPNRTPWGLIPCYWLREQAAILEAFAFTDIGWLHIERIFN